jgi:DNA-binding HxlR family transcriptional regulator
MSRRSQRPLGRTQVLVMHLLALEPKTVRTLSNDWPGLTEAIVSGALSRLADRGYVDRRAPHGFYQRHLTDRGVAAEREMVREKALAGVDEDDWEETDG